VPAFEAWKGPVGPRGAEFTMQIRISEKRSFYLPIEDFLSLNKPRELYWVTRFLELNGKEALLDIACGTGFWTRWLGRKSRYAVGVDINLSRLTQMGQGRKGKTRFAVASAESLPFPNNSYDRVVSVCALEHFQSDTRALAEMHRVLREEGLLVLTVDSLSHPAVDAEYREFHRRKYFVNNYYDAEIIRVRLERAGFEILEHRFIMSSALTFHLQRFFHGNTRQRAILIPLMLPVSILADKLAGGASSGMILAIKARKKRVSGSPHPQSM
jgi:SAM-dependent methyltransferase